MLPYALITMTVASLPLGHPNVGEHHVGTERVHEGERLFSGCRALHFVPVTPEQRLQHESQVFFVIDDQDPAHYEKNASSLSLTTQRFPAFLRFCA
jgi:hypothetical protein